MKECRLDNCSNSPVLDGLCISCYRVVYGVTVMNALGMKEQSGVMPHEDKSKDNPTTNEE